MPVRSSRAPTGSANPRRRAVPPGQPPRRASGDRLPRAPPGRSQAVPPTPRTFAAATPGPSMAACRSATKGGGPRGGRAPAPPRLRGRRRSAAGGRAAPVGRGGRVPGGGAEGVVVGHVLLSRLVSPPGALALAPLAVLPDRQRRGVGSALVRAALARAREGGGAAAFVLGDPAYYGRFGFSAEAARGYASPYAGGALHGGAARPRAPARRRRRGLPRTVRRPRVADRRGAWVRPREVG